MIAPVRLTIMTSSYLARTPIFEILVSDWSVVNHCVGFILPSLLVLSPSSLSLFHSLTLTHTINREREKETSKEKKAFILPYFIF